MKKIASFIIACLMLLAAAACSNGVKPAEPTKQPEQVPTEFADTAPTEEPKEEDPLAAKTFVDIYSYRILDLSEDNTMTYGEFSGIWEKEGSKIKLTYKYPTSIGVENEVTRTLDIVEDENGLALIQDGAAHFKTVSGEIGYMPGVLACYEEAYAPVAAEKIAVGLGETVSSDILEVTVESAEFCYYASSTLNETYGLPVSEEDFGNGIFVANKGRTLISFVIKIKNTDRGSIYLADKYRGWNIDWKILYGDKEYSINGFDLNGKDGSGGLNFNYAAISLDDGATFDYDNAMNYILREGETIIARVVGIVVMEPDSLEDGFKIVVNVFNSDEENEYYIYRVD